MSRIYLDNNATTPIHPEVLRVAEESLREVWGNASSVHQEGQRARQSIEDARESVARLIGAAARDVVFTSGGTESNNAGMFGAIPREGRHHIVATAIEHPSVAEAVAELERRGHRVTYVPPGHDGVVPLASMIAAIKDDTRLVSMMLANNETGIVQPVAAVASACRERGIHFHCDAVQGAGKIDLDVNALGCDTLSIAAHKMHGPKGIGALYVRRGLALNSHLVGGAQERRRRAGTENVPLAAAFGAAATIALDTSWREEAAHLRDRLETEMRHAFDIEINGAEVARLPQTSNITFRGADGEGLVIALDLHGIAVSTGSACSSGRVEPSRVLLAMGISQDDSRSTLRFSLSRMTAAGEIERTIAILRDLVPRCTRPVAGAAS